MHEVRNRLAEIVRQEGFQGFGICDPESVSESGLRLRSWVADGSHGEMDWMADRLPWREHPLQLWPAARSVIVVAESYAPETDPLETLGNRERGSVATYAHGRDYHDIIKKRLKRIARWLCREAGGSVKVFVDTAPVMEKPLAEAAGIGWQGKHTNLVSTTLGSWFLLGSIFTTLTLPRDPRHVDRCGSCRRCLDICPTAAFPAPYRLDARRCISYLTIEHKTPIPRNMRPLIGNRIFGCDDCLAVCPWNRFAATAHTNAAYLPRNSSDATELRRLARLNEAEFREMFRGTPIRRTGRNRFLRNVLIAIGNSGSPKALREVRILLSDPSALVRGAAVWALFRLAPQSEIKRLMELHLPREPDSDVRSEWVHAMKGVHR